jgi:hypothetical protein
MAITYNDLHVLQNYALSEVFTLLREPELNFMLQTSGEDFKRFRYDLNYTRNELRRCKTTLETSGENVKLHS